MENLEKTDEETKEMKPTFKKPVLIGKIGRLPRKITSKVQIEEKITVEKPTEVTPLDENVAGVDRNVPEEAPQKVTLQEPEEKGVVLPYKEPEWSGLPESSTTDYKFEVLKSGSIIETINLMKKPFWVFGRLPECDINMQHPTISRYHAVLQYRSEITGDQEPGFYLYDLNSTHGTFLNKNRLKPKVFARVHVGHMIKLGCSTRAYLLTGPQDDVESETELGVTELKKQRNEELLKREEEALKKIAEEEERLRKEEERGVDWGMGDDAEEETDLSENPYAQTNNEELYIDDPKKALRGFMEREGISWEYDCTEQGMGQFLCKVMLPLDDERGRPIVAEVLHKGKKKEAVVQCVLEACRILDRYGVLRQAVHESRKRKAKNWEENDYYDSDEDTFLDRTGTIEKKRENRMKGKIPQQPETYQSLMEKEKTITKSIQNMERQLTEATKCNQPNSSSLEEDSLDSFMKELKQSPLDKQKISKLKSELTKLKQEHLTLIKLINIAKPTDLPPLTPQYSADTNKNKETKAKLPIFGKRLKVKVQLPARPSVENFADNEDDEENDNGSNVKVDLNAQVKEKQVKIRNIAELESALNKMNFSQSSKEHLKNLLNTITSFKALSNSKSVENLNWDHVNSHMQKIMEFVGNANDRNNSELLTSFSKLSTVFEEKIRSCTAKLENEPTKSGLHQKHTKCEEIEVDISSASSVNEEITEEELDKRKKKNQRRIQQRQERSELEKQKGYEEDSMKEDYSMWLPPEGQSGDGRTSLNEKFGY